MPKEHKKRGRWEEKKRKREENEHEETSKRQKSEETEAVEGDDENIEDGGGISYREPYMSSWGPGSLPYYGLLDEDEQEYFKRADSMLELNQFAGPEERALFLANVYKEANGKELKIANSQSCSRLMERLILLSTPSQLKALFQKFSGHFLFLVQHRFASHCCEALFLRAAPIVTQELIAPPEAEKHDTNAGNVYVSMENLFLYTLNELKGNLGYLMTHPFASHTLRVLLVVLSGKPLTDMDSGSLLQSKKKERIIITSSEISPIEPSKKIRIVPEAFLAAADKMIYGTVAGLDTTKLRSLATHPIANPVLQLLLELELSMSENQSIKDKDSLFRKLLPEYPLEEGTESASFINALVYDIIGSRLLEVIVAHAPGKIFKGLYRCSFSGKLGSLAKNEVAAFVVIRILERLNKEDLLTAVDQICPHIGTLIKRSRTSVIKVLIERCRIRRVETQPILDALKEANDEEPSGTLIKMLSISAPITDNMAEDRRKKLDSQDSTKAHGSLLAQCMLISPGPLRELITEGLLALENTVLIHMSKDRTASRVLQTALTCTEQSTEFRRALISRFYGHVNLLAVDTVGSRVVDSFWEASESLTFIRESIAEELAIHEASLRVSISGRAVWRNWKMDLYKARRHEWLNTAKGRAGHPKSGIELARERFAANKKNGRQTPSKREVRTASGANTKYQKKTAVQGKA